MNHLILLLEKGKQLLVSHVKGNPPILYLCLLSVDDFRIEPPTFEKNWICTYLLCANTGSHKTLGTILRDPIVPSSVGQVGLSGYSAVFSSQSAR